MRRRAFISLLGGGAAIAWPLAPRAQQSPMPVVGVLGSASAQFKDALVRGLSEAGYIEGQNVCVEYRLAAGAYDRLSAMADELVNLRVNVIATLGAAAAPDPRRSPRPLRRRSRHPFQWSSFWEAIRSRRGWLRASTGPAAT
jgi:hypothetical protein